MKQKFFNIYQAGKNTLSTKRQRLIFIGIFILTFCIFIIVPVLSVPGNDLWFQLKIFSNLDYVILTVLALLNSLLILLQWRIYKKKKDFKQSAVAIGSSSSGALSAIFAAVVSTASCSACLTGILGFLGSGGILFVIEYRPWFVAGALLIVLTAIYISSQTLQDGCDTCHIKPLA